MNVICSGMNGNIVVGGFIMFWVWEFENWAEGKRENMVDFLFIWCWTSCCYGLLAFYAQIYTHMHMCFQWVSMHVLSFIPCSWIEQNPCFQHLWKIWSHKVTRLSLQLASVKYLTLSLLPPVSPSYTHAHIPTCFRHLAGHCIDLY